MAVILEDTFETGDLTAWYDQSPDPPTIISSDKFKGNYCMRATDIAGAQWTRYLKDPGTLYTVARFYLKIPSHNQVSWTSNLLDFANGQQTRSGGLALNFDSAGVIKAVAQIWDGTNTFNSTESGVLSLGTWYRFEMKFDTSGSQAKMTWGYAVENGTLTTVDTDFTGANAYGANEQTKWFRFGLPGFYSLYTHWDSIKIADTAGEYPLGIDPLVNLDSVLPDADITTTGWSTAPLYSKINDASDATVIQATAS